MVRTGFIVWRLALLVVAAYALYLAMPTPNLIDNILVGILVGSCASDLKTAITED